MGKEIKKSSASRGGFFIVAHCGTKGVGEIGYFPVKENSAANSGHVRNCEFLRSELASDAIVGKEIIEKKEPRTRGSFLMLS